MEAMPTMNLTLPIFCALSLVACAPRADLPTGGVSVNEPRGEAVCDSAPAQEFVGRMASDDLAMPILQATGAEQLRWGGPETVFTMDYREDRVNAIYDADSTIDRIYCG